MPINDPSSDPKPDERKKHARSHTLLSSKPHTYEQWLTFWRHFLVPKTPTQGTGPIPPADPDQRKPGAPTDETQQPGRPGPAQPLSADDAGKSD